MKEIIDRIDREIRQREEQIEQLRQARTALVMLGGAPEAAPPQTAKVKPAPRAAAKPAKPTRDSKPGVVRGGGKRQRGPYPCTACGKMGHRSDSSLCKGPTPKADAKAKAPKLTGKAAIAAAAARLKARKGPGLDPGEDMHEALESLP